ncbi:MAG: hypothetical protein EBV86_12745 [Marivivens sp.]|nr:hypothetical protein [Marivivens sp.]
MYSSDITIEDGETHTLSVFVNNSSRTAFQLKFSNTGETNGCAARFNLTDTAVDNTQSIGTGTFTDASIQYAGDDWFLCTLTGSLPAGTTTARMRMSLWNGSSHNYTGDGNSRLFFWGAQVTQSSKPLVMADVRGYTATTSVPVYWGNSARIDHDPSTAVRRTNLRTHSDTSDGTSTWSDDGTGMTHVYSVSGDPSGGSDAVSHTPDANGAFAWRDACAASLMIGGEEYTTSIYLKGASSFDVSVIVQERGGNYTSYATGTFSVTTSWQRFDITYTKQDDGNPARFILNLDSGEVLYSFGLQTEEGSSATDYIKTVAAPVEVIDTYATPKGILIEESRTNESDRSSELNDASWTNSNVTVTANEVKAPDGSVTADKLESTSGFDYVDNTISGTAGSMTASCFFKATGSGQYAWVGFGQAGGGKYIEVDLSDGSVQATSGSPTSYGVEDYGDGWYRAWVVHTYVSGTLSINIGPSNGSFTGGGTGECYAWGAQVEVGAFPTSYIPTVSATVTRADDLATVPDISAIDSTKGSFVLEAEYQEQVPTGAAHYALFLNNGGTNTSYSHIVYKDASELVGVQINDSTNQVNFTRSRSGTSPTDVAYAYATNNVRASYDGDTSSEDTSATLPTLTTMVIGGRGFDFTRQLNGHVQKVQYWPHTWENSILEDLSGSYLWTDYEPTIADRSIKAYDMTLRGEMFIKPVARDAELTYMNYGNGHWFYSRFISLFPNHRLAPCYVDLQQYKPLKHLIYRWCIS